MNGVKHTYSLEGSLIVSEEYGDYLLIYLYDETNSPYGIIRHNKADGTTSQYYLERDVFGNIIAIYNRSGTKVASYVYDAWGNCTAYDKSNGEDYVVNLNPFRYRGYYLDVETNLYYLQSRYYDSYVGRFINADGVRFIGFDGDLTSYNLYTYCNNNPVMGYDASGYWNWGGFFAGVAIVAAGVLLTVATAGAASPVLALVGTVVGTAVISTGTVTATAAATDSAMVVDWSASNMDNHKVGVSLVVDFSENTFDLYTHDGMNASTGGSPFTYGVGFVYNYESIGDYGGTFINAGGSVDWFGVDYCRSPDLNPNSVSASSFTFGLPGTKGINGYVGWDYYYPVAHWGGK